MVQATRLTIADQLLETLKTRIVRGEIEAGSKFTEQDLADTFQVSRGPLREALRRLEGLHLVEHISHRGVRVVSLNARELLEIYEVRESLEGTAAALAAGKMTDTEIAELKSLLNQHETEIERSDASDYFQKEGDFDFHYRVIQGSKNRRLIKLLCDELYHMIRMYRYRSSTTLSRPVRALAEHRNIVNAIEDRDSALAEMLMRRHISRARRNIEQQVLFEEI